MVLRLTWDGFGGGATAGGTGLVYPFWLPGPKICQTSQTTNNQTKFEESNLLYSLESKTPVLLSKQGFVMGSYIRRGLTLE